jgi:hypothetical protein
MKPLYHQNSGMALPITMLLVAFNVIVLVALLTYATTEMNASRNAAGSSTSRVMALNGIELAGALIAANSTNNAYVSYQNIVTNSGPRLETKIANVVAIPGAADPSFQRQLTNPTALHSGFTVPGQGVDLNYATRADTNSGYIVPRTNPTGSNWRNLHTNMFQMKWVNVYKGDTNVPTNLIGRFAFWVDDESTKLNINYSGQTNNYDATSFDLSGRNQQGLFGPRADKGSNQNIGGNFRVEMWPLYMDLGGVAGLSRTNVVQILSRRGNPIWKTDDDNNSLFRPYYSLLESRLATVPPAVGGVAITNITQQSQLGFTATVYSREPEITYASGRPRFDLFDFTMNWSSNSTRTTAAEKGLLNAFNLNYSGFSQKYSLPQFIAALRSRQTPYLSGANATTNFPYTSAGLETTNYNARSIPLINETMVKLNSQYNGTTSTTTLEAKVELLFMFKAYDDGYGKYDQTIFDDIGMSGSRYATNALKYAATISFSPPIVIENNPPISTINLVPDTNQWFSNSLDTNSIKPYNTNLTGLFGVLKATTNIPTANPDKVVWAIPSNLIVNTTIKYSNSPYQSVSATYSTNTSLNWTNLLTNTVTNGVVFWWTSMPRGDQGVRGDPRLGLHSVDLQTAFGEVTLGTNRNLNPMSTIGSLNPTNNWQPDKFEGHPLSPDITPPQTFFALDRGPFHGQQFSDSYMTGPNFPSSGHLGEIPITTFKSGYHLAWSTPRFWGDGRTNMGDSQIYPPDWFMLDCVHTAMFPPETNKPFANYPTNFVSYGRLNINGLKSYFQNPTGSSNQSDTIVDSLLVGALTVDFRDPPNPQWLSILKNDTNRIKLLNYINSEIVQRGSTDNPFLTGFDFTAQLAGNTNNQLTNISGWQYFTPGATNTSDSRIESLVRSLQQRVTSHGFQFSVFSLGQSVQVVQSGSTYKTNVIGESYFQAVWERAPKHDTNGIISNASAGGAPPLRLLYMRELR